MSLKNVAEKAIEDLTQAVNIAQQDPWIAAFENTTLGPGGRTLITRLISEAEALEASWETDKQAAAATAYQQGHADAAAQEPPAGE